MDDMEVEIRKKPPKNSLNEQPQDNVTSALKQEYVVQNFKDRKVTMLNTAIGAKDATGKFKENPLKKLLTAHAIATQGGLWRQHPEKESAFWQLYDLTKWAVNHMAADNPFIQDCMDIIDTQFFMRYNIALEPEETKPGPVVATMPVFGLNPGGYGQMMPGQPMGPENIPQLQVQQPPVKKE
jgi:hypothetical protein